MKSSSFQKQKNPSRMGSTSLENRKLHDKKQFKSCKIFWKWWNETILKYKRMGYSSFGPELQELLCQSTKICTSDK